MTTHVFPNDPLALLFDPTAALPTIVQGITGRMGRKHAALMRAYGTDIVGGTAPAGSKSADLKDVDGAPVFRSCAEAVKNIFTTALGNITVPISRPSNMAGRS